MFVLFSAFVADRKITPGYIFGDPVNEELTSQFLKVTTVGVLEYLLPESLVPEPPFW